MRCVRGSGPERFRGGSGCGTHLPRGRGQGFDHVMVRDLDLSQVPGVDGRRLEVVAEGLSLFGGAQLAIDATLVSALRGDGTARVGAHTPGAALKASRRRKERTYPELAGEWGRARLVVLAGEVGGLWSSETASFFSSLAQHKLRGGEGGLRC